MSGSSGGVSGGGSSAGGASGDNAQMIASMQAANKDAQEFQTAVTVETAKNSKHTAKNSAEKGFYQNVTR